MAAKKADVRNEAFAGAIGRHIEAKRLKRSEFAARVGISRITLHNWMDNPGIVTLTYLRILAREAQISDNDILTIVRGNRS